MRDIEKNWNEFVADYNEIIAKQKASQYRSFDPDVVRFHNDHYVFEKIRDEGFYYDQKWIQDENEIRKLQDEWIEFKSHLVSKSVDKQQQLKLKLKQKHIMNKASKTRLKAVEFKYLSYRYPTAPGHTIPFTVYSDKTANGLTKCICDFLNFSDYQAERINTMGVFRRSRRTDGTMTEGQWTKGTGTPGSADISATIYGRSVKIEVKIGKDRQSEAQKNYQAMIERSGGTYFIAKDFDLFLEWFDKFCLDKK